MIEEPSQELVLMSPQDTPGFRKLVAPLPEACWPEFMLHDAVADEHWGALFERFPEYQFGLMDAANDRAAAMGNSVPLRWEKSLEELPEAGWDWALEQAVRDHGAGREPNLHCAIQVAIHPAYRGRGVSLRMVDAMRAMGRAKGFGVLVAPVRPSQKAAYPLCSIDRYITWTDKDGLPFDAWLRVHARLGARILKPCHQAMTISGRVADWEAWTTMRFPESGEYYIPGALNPVSMDVQRDLGTYVEPNVWMAHPLA